jgi:DNA-binding CsgD family transcriptional regulator
MERGIIPEHLARADLTRLNAAELEVLHLFADGHTAKSVASLTGRSVASVNERLRQARRKTGVSSSRELARLVKAQENRNEKTELVNHVIAEPDLSPFSKGALFMVTLLFAAAVAATMHQAPDLSQAPLTQKDPVLKGVLDTDEDNPFRLAQLVRNETRDEQWANRLEAALRERFSSLAADGRVQLTKVTCGRTICEIVGKINESDQKVMSNTVEALQKPDLNAITGVKHAAIAFGPKGFVSYWKRS